MISTGLAITAIILGAAMTLLASITIGLYGEKGYPLVRAITIGFAVGCLMAALAAVWVGVAEGAFS